MSEEKERNEVEKKEESNTAEEAKPEKVADTSETAVVRRPEKKTSGVVWGLRILGIIALAALLVALIALVGDDKDNTEKNANKAVSKAHTASETATAAEAKAKAAKKKAKKALSESVVASETAAAAEAKAKATIDALCRKHPCDALCKEKRPQAYERCLAWRKRAKKRRSRRWRQRKPTSTPANPALAERVSNLETRVDRHEVLLKPLDRLKRRYGKAYDKRVEAALSRLPDKVQAGSK